MSGLLEEALTGYLASTSDVKCYWVALSGGLDSTVLLHALARKLPPTRLKAIHVDHQLHQDSAHWADRAHQTASGLGIDIEVIKISVEGADNIEAKARKARYDAFARCVGPQDRLLTAHHRSDQAETLLLKCFHGAGPEGLQGIRSSRKHLHLRVDRPLLSTPLDELSTYAAQACLQWVDDPSNELTRFERNWVRHKLMPGLTERFEGVEKAIAQSSERMAVADKLLRELAAQDIPLAEPRCDLNALAPLSFERKRNAIAAWVYAQHETSAPWRTLTCFVQQCCLDANDAELQLDGLRVKRWRNTLYCLPVTLPERPLPHSWDGKTPLWVAGKRYTIAPHDRERLEAGPLKVTYWGHLQDYSGSPSKHHLKNYFQRLSIPPWERPYIPLIYNNNNIIVARSSFSED